MPSSRSRAPPAAQTYALKAPIATKPAFLTTVGQSADIEMVKVLLDRGAVPYKADAQAKAGDLAASGAKTLVVVLGGSTKGLGAAGISADAEIDRAKALLAEAKKLGMTIIGVHVGGEARRGQLSDTFIQAAVPACHYVVVVADGRQGRVHQQAVRRHDPDRQGGAHVEGRRAAPEGLQVDGMSTPDTLLLLLTAACFVALVVAARLPVSLSLAATSVVLALAAGKGFPLAHLVEGMFSYLDVVAGASSPPWCS